MSERDDLLGRLKELHTGEETRRSTARAILKMINHGDLAGAATALDDLETALHPALAVGGGPSEPAVLPGFKVHWFKSPAWSLNAGQAWTSSDEGFGLASIDEDTDGFWDSESESAIIPVGLGGRYAIRMFVSYASATATGFISANPVGTNQASYGPCLIADDTDFQGLTMIDLVDFEDETTDADQPFVENLTNHAVLIQRVEIALVRLGSKP